MAEIESMLLSLPDYTTNANVVKDLVIRHLWKNGVITEEQADEYLEKMGVVIIKSGWFKNWIKKFKKEENIWTYRLVRLEE